MHKYEKTFHKFALSLGFSVASWQLITRLLVAMSFWKYLVIELVLLFSWKLYSYTLSKLHLNG